MTWWIWTLIWTALVAGALVVLFLIARSLWRKGMALARELADVSGQLATAAEGLQAAGDGAAVEELAVFRNPAELRVERIHARRSRAGRPVPASAGLPERERFPRRA